MYFHHNVGSLITLKNNGSTAMRRNPHQDFNNAIVFSALPLIDDTLFEIRIDKRIEIWSGSVDIGVTACNPDTIDLPSCASSLLTDTWIMSGATILHNGRPILNGYGHELHPLREGDTLGVMRNKNGQLHIFVNDTDIGVAASGIPSCVWAVVDLYGKCTEVTCVDSASRMEPRNRALSPVGDTNTGAVDSNSSSVSMSVSTVLHTADSIFRDLAHRMRRQSSAEHALLAAALEAVTSSTSPNPTTTANATIEEMPGPVGEILNAGENGDSVPLPPLQFHEKSGKMVRLSGDRRTAERRRPTDEFNNAVVMTNRPLQPGEFFELRIDRIIQKWTGSIEMGVTTHNPDHIDLPATMSNLRSGTIIMSGCGILTNGRGTRREYGEFHLDVLKVGDRVGMMLRPTNHLHFYINGRDQGMAAVCRNGPYWGVVDLYGMTVKVTLMHPVTPPAPSTTSSPSSTYRQLEGASRRALAAAVAAVGVAGRVVRRESGLSEDEDNYEETEKLVFHHRSGASVQLDNSNRTAYRNNPEEDFNEGVVITNRPLRPGEIFTVQLERTVSKWAGTLEIGVTSSNPAELKFPTTMTNLTSADTYMMTSNGVMHNGITVLDHYGPPKIKTKLKPTRQRSDGVSRNDGMSIGRGTNSLLRDLDQLEEEEDEDEEEEEEEDGAVGGSLDDDEPDRLHVWDLVGVQRRPDGNLHFYVNGVDLGCAARNVPPVVYGVVDLYGRAAQVSILSPSAAATALNAHVACLSPPLAFHHSHGRNACVAADGSVAYRPHAQSEFNDAILVSTRPLLNDELFEVRVERMVDRWSGSLEAGVTLIPAERLRFPSTMTDLEHETWVLSGNSVMRDGKTILSQYTFDLDCLILGSRVGLLRRSDGSLHFFLDGNDMGAACRDVPEGVYALIDLYGQCAQVSLTSRTGIIVPAGSTVIPVEDDMSASNPVVIMSTSMEGTERLQTSQDATTAPMQTSTVSSTQPSAMVSSLTGQDRITTPILNQDARDTSTSPADGLTAVFERFMCSGPSIDSDLTTRSRAANICKFNFCHGPSVRLDEARTVATRKRSMAVQSGLAALVFSADPIHPDELLELEVSSTEPRPDMPCGEVGGLLAVGLVDWVVDKDAVEPATLPELACQLEKAHWLIAGGHVVASGRTVKSNYAPRLELASSEPLRVGVHYSAEATLSVFLNDMYLGAAAKNVPKNCFLVIDLGGSMNCVQFKSARHLPLRRSGRQSSIPCRIDDVAEILKSDSLPCLTEAQLSCCEEEEVTEDEDADTEERNPHDSYPVCPEGDAVANETVTAVQGDEDVNEVVLEMTEGDVGSHSLIRHEDQCESEEVGHEGFWHGSSSSHFLFGSNIRIMGHPQKLSRCNGFRHGLVIGKMPLAKLQLFQVYVNRVEEKAPDGEWSGSLTIGFIASQVPPEELFPSDRAMPDSASNLLAGKLTLTNPENISTLSYCQVTGSDVIVDRIPYRANLMYDLSKLMPGDWVGLLLDSEGIVRLSVNGDDLGPLLASDCINTSIPLYPFVDVYGRCKEVNLTTIPSVAVSLSRDRIAEKAGTELNELTGEKHKSSTSTSSSPPPVESASSLAAPSPSLCQHRQLLVLVRRLLFLPDSAFRPTDLRCFCTSCRPPSLSSNLDLNTDLPKDPNTLPLGWARLGLQRSLQRGHHLAFISRLSPLHLRLLLDTGDPTRLAWEDEEEHESWTTFLSGGAEGEVEGGRATSEREKECGKAVRMIPDVSRACGMERGIERLGRGFEFSYDSHSYAAHFVMEVRVRPGSYTVMPQGSIGMSTGSRTVADSTIWTTKEMGAVLPTGLLVKVVSR